MKIVSHVVINSNIIKLIICPSQVKDEIFGPVLALGKFTTEEEGVKLANDTSYGLGAGLHSSKSTTSRLPDQPINLCLFCPFVCRRHPCILAVSWRLGNEMLTLPNECR